MPLIALAVAAWDAGLLAGFAAGGPVPVCVALVLFAAALVCRRPKLVGITLITVAALVTAHSRAATPTAARAEPPGRLERIRLTAARAADATFPRDAALVRALTLADARDLPRDLRDDFAAAGLAHFLAI